jgi:hypothetical protein
MYQHLYWWKRTQELYVFTKIIDRYIKDVIIFNRVVEFIVRAILKSIQCVICANKLGVNETKQIHCH